MIVHVIKKRDQFDLDQLDGTAIRRKTLFLQGKIYYIWEVQYRELFVIKKMEEIYTRWDKLSKSIYTTMKKDQWTETEKG